MARKFTPSAGVSSELVALFKAHYRATRAYEAAMQKADNASYRVRKLFAPRPAHLMYAVKVGDKSVRHARMSLELFDARVEQSTAAGMELCPKAHKAMRAELVKYQRAEAAMLRKHGVPALDAAAQKASNAMDKAEKRCTQFPARSIADLAAKLQFAALQYDLLTDAAGMFEGVAIASALSDAVRLAQKGGAA